jgi:hypothetical protein
MVVAAKGFDAHAGEISNRNSSHILALCRGRLSLPRVYAKEGNKKNLEN